MNIKCCLFFIHSVQGESKKTDTFWIANQPQISMQKFNYSHMGVQRIEHEPWFSIHQFSQFYSASLVLDLNQF